MSIVLDDLVAGESRGHLHPAPAAFVGVDDAPEMREFFEGEMSAEDANRGRWAEGAWLRSAAAASAGCTSARSRDLQMEGNHVAAPLIAAYERGGVPDASSSSPRTAPDSGT